MSFAPLLLLLLPALFSSAAVAQDSPVMKKSGKASAVREQAFGRPGNAASVSRTIAIEMSDAMRYTPASLQVRRGETIRLDVANSGKVMHELVLGTMAELKEHAVAMRKHGGMHHGESMHHESPYMVHVKPGSKETLVWQFTRPGEFYYGCLVPGHFEAGMIGKIVVTSGSRDRTGNSQ